MDLQTLEAHKALAAEAFRRGALTEADAFYRSIEAEYARHRADDALVAVQFNRLLLALEKGDRPGSANLMASLAERLEERVGDSSMIVEVAERICRLFAEPFPGVEHEATAALVAIAGERARPGLPRRSCTVDLDALPGPDALARLHAEDAAALLLELAEALNGRPGCPAWVRAVQRTFGEPRPLDERVPQLVRAAHGALDKGDTFHGYQSLVVVFAEACDRQPALAAELALGLSTLEDAGLPERLAFTPSLPEERRLAMTAELYARLASGLAGEAGLERLALGLWRRVLELAEAWSRRAGRRRSRGSARAGDAEQDACLSIWRSRAARSLGDLETAATALATNVARARRQAFSTPYLAALVLREAADVAERSGDRSGAHRLFGEAVQIATPGAAQASSPERRRRAMRAALEDAPRIALAAEGLAGLARTGADREQGKLWLDTAASILALARPHLDVAVWTHASMLMELTGAQLAVSGSPLRALEAARALEDRPGIALALLYQGLTLHRGLVAEETPGQCLEVLTEAATEARASAAGAVRRAVEIAVGVVHQARADRADPARVEIHLRRAAEAAEGATLADRAGPLDVMLPLDEALALEPAIARLVDEGDASLARRLCAAARRRDGRVPVSTSPGPVAAAVREALRARFRDGLLSGGERVPMTQVWRLLDDARPPVARSLGTPHRGEARIEFRVFDDWSAVFVVTASGVRMHRWSVTRDALAQQVETLRGHLEADAMSPFLDAATACWRLLIEPLLYDLDGVERLVVAPDGPLVRLPFGLLWGGNFLAEYFDLATARPAAPPAFGGETAVASPSALIVGDAATGRDLQISTLVAPGAFHSVDARHGDVVADGLAEALDGGRVVHLVGEVVPGPAVELADEYPPIGAVRLAEAMGEAGTVCATVMGPLSGRLGEVTVGALLGGVRGGVLARRWIDDEERAFLLMFLSRAAGATDARGLVAALGEARRAAIRAHLSPRSWGAYSLYLAEGQ